MAPGEKANMTTPELDGVLTVDEFQHRYEFRYYHGDECTRGLAITSARATASCAHRCASGHTLSNGQTLKGS